MSLGERMKSLRSGVDLSQQQVAENIGMARATYAALEANKREPDLAVLRAISQFYEISISDLINPGWNLVKVNKSTVTYRNHNEVTQVQRDTNPRVNPEKLREVLLYILAKVGARPNVGETVLYKLLYFIDFDYYEKHGKSITGLTYVRNFYGPTPTMAFVDIVKQMERNNELEVVSTNFFNNTQRKYLPIKTIDLRELSAKELIHIDYELTRLGDKTASELSALSHYDMPWLSAKQGEPLQYRDVFYRSDITAVTEPEDEL